MTNEEILDNVLNNLDLVAGVVVVAVGLVAVIVAGFVGKKLSQPKIKKGE